MTRKTIYEEGDVRVTTGTVEIKDKVFTFSELGELVIIQQGKQSPSREIGAPAIAISLIIPGFILGNMMIVGLGFAVLAAMLIFFKPGIEYVLEDQSEPEPFEVYKNSDPEKVAELKQAIAQARASI